MRQIFFLNNINLKNCTRITLAPNFVIMSLQGRILGMNIILLLLLLVGCNNANLPLSKESASNLNDTNSIIKKPINPFQWNPIKYDSTKEYVYLTFDDGPQNGTQAVYDLIKKLNVKATFFMVGSHANSSHLKSIVHQIKYSYPQILLANHSTSHANNHYKYFYHHPYMALQDFYLAQKSMAVPYKIIRLPGNSAWVFKDTMKASSLVRPICGLLDSSGYNVIGWDVEWGFNHKTAYPIQKPQKMVDQVDSALVKNRVHNSHHVVILAHDRMFRKPNFIDSLDKFITILKKNPKVVFETVDHYPHVKVVSK